MKFQIYSLGCKVNQYDSANLRKDLESRGFKISDNPDLVIINTCTVTKSAISKDRQLSNKLSRDFPKSKIVVMGCWPQTDKDIKNALGKIDSERLILWGVGNREKLIDKIESKLGNVKLNKKNVYGQPGLLVSSDKSRYFIKIGDGCNQFCSYCLIPFARGRLRSRNEEDILKEIKEAIDFGYKEIVLSGIHLGRYGEDKKDGEINFYNLLKKIISLKGLGRIRLSSIEINELSDEIIELIASTNKICPHLHISLQSGCNKILKLMKRPYTKEYFLRRVKKIRKLIPNIAISTDVIVGFPGENKKDFKETCDFVKDVNFSKVHVFSYSPHEKTASYKLSNRVKAEDIKERSKILRGISLVQEKNYKDMVLKNENIYIVVQSIKRGNIKGMSQFSFDINVGYKNDNIEIGSLFKIDIKH